MMAYQINSVEQHDRQQCVLHIAPADASEPSTQPLKIEVSGEVDTRMARAWLRSMRHVAGVELRISGNKVKARLHAADRQARVNQSIATSSAFGLIALGVPGRATLAG